MASDRKVALQTCSIFDKDIFNEISKGIKVSVLMRLKQVASPVEDISQMIQELNVSDRRFCSYCDVSFPDHIHQRLHYKMDWHRYNLKQHLANKKNVSEDRFIQIADMDDVSSISGSESDSETEGESSSVTEMEDMSDERVSHMVARCAKLLFENANGQLVSLYQSLLLERKCEAPSEKQLVSLAARLPSMDSWLIIMMGGGHMAAAVFKGTEAIRHKTFHSYTVRAKQGGSQGAKDNTGKHAKSAGASLRRYNEQILTQHVQEILSTWSAEVAACQLIFYRAVGPHNRSMLFGGKSAPLNKSDPRLRTVPFPTRRATFSEVQRVHSLLSTVTIYDSPDVFRSTLASPVPRKKAWREDREGEKSDKESRSPKKFIDRAKERPSPERALPDIVAALAAIESSSESENGEDIMMYHNNEEIHMNSLLQEFEDSVPNRKKKKKHKKEKSSEKEWSGEVGALRKAVVLACLAGDVATLQKALEQQGVVVSKEQRAEAMNQLTADDITLLQDASQRALPQLIWTLLENGANPCTKDKRAMTAYDFAPDKETRSTFRRFMGQFPQKYDYSKSHIPSALTTEGEQEQTEKRRAIRRAKRQREKEKRIADEPRRQEEAEKKRFLELSEREKRALAAERRALAAAGKAGIVLQRCYICATDITGKVPFTYENFLFCSMECLKAHRKQHKCPS